jgi:hypothetical protein
MSSLRTDDDRGGVELRLILFVLYGSYVIYNARLFKMLWVYQRSGKEGRGQYIPINLRRMSYGKDIRFVLSCSVFDSSSDMWMLFLRFPCPLTADNR